MSDELQVRRKALILCASNPRNPWHDLAGPALIEQFGLRAHRLAETGEIVTSREVAPGHWRPTGRRRP